MQDYMIEKIGVGSYKNTYEHTLKNFAAKDPVEMAENSGIPYDKENSMFTLQSYGQPMTVHYPDGTIQFKGTVSSPLWSWRLIILNHLARSDDAPIGESLITFREAESGNVFNSAFYKRNIVPLIDRLDDKAIESLQTACVSLGGTLQKGADVCAVFDFLPRFPITLKFWCKDDELAGSANFLYHSNANHYLHTEDIVVATTLLTDFLIKQVEEMETQAPLL